MQAVDRKEHLLMKRIAVIIGVGIAAAATPALVTAGGSSHSRGNANSVDTYRLAHTWNSGLGELYGPVQVAPATYGFIAR